MSKSAYGFVKSKFCIPPQLSHPSFHPSNKTPSISLAAAKSIYFLALAVVAPWRSSIFQVSTPKCIPHHTPTYFKGRIQSVVSSTQGSFRFKIKEELISPTASGAIWMVRQEVVKWLPLRTLIPSGQGVSSAFNVYLPVCFKVISEKSYKAASWILP